MITINKATEVPIADTDNQPMEETELVVEIEIDGIPWSVGGLDPSLTRAALQQYLDSRYDEILAEAQAATITPETTERPDLVTFTADTLPKSAHYAQLTAVHPSDRLKAEVRRYFQGEWYGGIRCLASTTALEAYRQGKIAIGDYVKVDFIEESLPAGEKTIPIVMDKVEL